jgi:hypothetical protein
MPAAGEVSEIADSARLTGASFPPTTARRMPCSVTGAEGQRRSFASCASHRRGECASASS